MTKQTEAIKMTIKAIEWIPYKNRTLKLKCALYACKEALEQPVVMERDYNFMRDLAIGCEDALVTKDEALHKALKVLNCLNNDRVYETAWVKGAINACEEALEQPNRFEGYTTIEIGHKKPAQESISEEDISLMAWNSCDEDWNSLGSRKCWLDGYEEGAKAMAKDLGIKVTK